MSAALGRLWQSVKAPLGYVVAGVILVLWVWVLVAAFAVGTTVKTTPVDDECFALTRSTTDLSLSTTSESLGVFCPTEVRK